MNQPRKWAVVAITCLAMMLLAIDLTVLHLAIPALTVELRPTATEILWIADSYTFALAGLLITMGNIGDRIGRKKLLLIGTTIFGIASVLVAYAPNPELLIAARAAQGFAAATVMPSTLSIVRNVFTDPKERTAAVGVWSAVGAGGAALGPVVGGVLLDHFFWGSVFLINVPVVLLILIGGLIVLPESRNPRPGRIDVASVALSIAGVVALVYAMKEAPLSGLTRPAVIVAAILGIGLITVFVRRQKRLAHPFMDVRLFRYPAFSASIGANLVTVFTLVVLSFAFSQLLQFVWGWSPWATGLAFLPIVVGITVGATMGGTLIPKLGRGGVVATGLGLSAAGFLVFVLIGVAPALGLLITAGVVLGCGLGVAMAVTTDNIVASAPKERAGAASAIAETAQELGGALGIAILGTLLSASYRAGLEVPAGTPAGAVRAIEESIGNAMETAARLPGEAGQAVAAAAREAFVSGVHVTAITGAVLLAIAGVAALMTMRGIPDVILDQHDLSEVFDGEDKDDVPPGKDIDSRSGSYSTEGGS
ncbi:MFS transporter [Nonomuraea sp. NPDC050643]|uniref:MFS transporter n=1 Tax=Nonomuraea sp. NPDC050643 TaxID=3155660 RepID=UPI0033EF0312